MLDGFIFAFSFCFQKMRQVCVIVVVVVVVKYIQDCSISGSSCVYLVIFVTFSSHFRNLFYVTLLQRIVHDATTSQMSNKFESALTDCFLRWNWQLSLFSITFFHLKKIKITIRNSNSLIFLIKLLLRQMFCNKNINSI